MKQNKLSQLIGSKSGSDLKIGSEFRHLKSAITSSSKKTAKRLGGITKYNLDGASKKHHADCKILKKKTLK